MNKKKTFYVNRILFLCLLLALSVACSADTDSLVGNEPDIDGGNTTGDNNDSNNGGDNNGGDNNEGDNNEGGNHEDNQTIYEDDPNNLDDDFDGLPDVVETNTGVFVDANDTGTDPYRKDSDADGVGDWYEVVASFTDPLDRDIRPNVPYPLPEPNGAEASNNMPVKVYILSGQSNMVGFGRVNGDEPGTLTTMTTQQNKFPHLLNEDGSWVSYDDVHYRGVITDRGNSPLKPLMAGDKFGPELGFGMVMGYYHDTPVLVLKSSQGNRSLIWDCLPPGSPRFENDSDGKTYSGYGDSRDSWDTGSNPAPFVWYAGKQYDDFFLDEEDFGCNTVWASGTNYEDKVFVKHGNLTYTSKSTHTASADNEPEVGANWQDFWNINSVVNVVDVLDNFASQYPQWANRGFEIAGFVWWQGHKDQQEVAASKYEENLVRLIKSLRSYYKNRYPGKIADNAPFVLGTIAFNGWQLSGHGLEVANAQLNVSEEKGNYPEFQGNVKTVEMRGYWRNSGPSGQEFHYFHNAETYMLAGDALGRGMINLLEN